MTDPGSIANAYPREGLDAVWDEIRQLRELVRQGQTAKVGNAMTVDGAPGITIAEGGGLTVQDGGGIEIDDGGGLTIDDGGGITVNDGGAVTLHGTGGLTVDDGGSIEVDDGGGINVNDGGDVTLKDGASLEVEDGGDINLRDGGTLRLFDSLGNRILLAGYSPSTGHSGLVTVRADGTVSFQADNSGFVGIIDRSANIIVSDDATSGVGLATPHLCGSTLQDTNVLNWPATTASSWTTIASCFLERQNPRIAWTIALSAYSTGVTGEFRLMVNGTRVGSVQSVTFATVYWSDVDDWPGGTDIFGDYYVELQAQITAGGPGTAAGIGMRMRGDQS